MIDFFVIVPILFFIFTVLMIGVAWISFMRNLIVRNPRERHRTGGTASSRNMNKRAAQRTRRQRTESMRPLPSTFPEEDIETEILSFEEELDAQAEVANHLEQEYNKLAATYDDFWENSFQEEENIKRAKSSGKSSGQEQGSLKSNRRDYNHEWLREAVLASEILKRPDY